MPEAVALPVDAPKQTMLLLTTADTTAGAAIFTSMVSLAEVGSDKLFGNVVQILMLVAAVMAILPKTTFSESGKLPPTVSMTVVTMLSGCGMPLTVHLTVIGLI